MQSKLSKIISKRLTQYKAKLYGSLMDDNLSVEGLNLKWMFG